MRRELSSQYADCQALHHDAARPVCCNATLGGGPYAATSTYAAEEFGRGSGSPSSRNPSRWNSMASRMLRSTASRVSPVETHPGMSGEYAEKPLSVSSMTMRYLLMASIPPA